MTAARQLQESLKEKLRESFLEVEIEWDSTKKASDNLRRQLGVRMYAPRVDVAVGPFSLSPGNSSPDIVTSFEDRCPKLLKERFLYNKMNSNPRCAIAIEVVFTGSAKRILGDIANASLMGLYGIVVASSAMKNKVEVVFDYIQRVKKLEKAPLELFGNVIILDEIEAMRLVSRPIV